MGKWDKYAVSTEKWSKYKADDTPKEGVIKQFGKGAQYDVEQYPVKYTERGEAYRDIPFAALMGMAATTLPTSAFTTPATSLVMPANVAMTAGKQIKNVPQQDLLKFFMKVNKKPSIFRRFGGEILKRMGVLDDVDADKIMGNSAKYTKRPLSSGEQNFKLDNIIQKSSTGLDDVISLKAKTVEDVVAGSSKLSRAVKVTDLIDENIKYVTDMMDKGIVDKTPITIQRLNERILREGGRSGYLSFKQAHQMKKEIYKIARNSYGKGNFKDVSAGAYKGTARVINQNLRKMSPEYAAGNDKMRPIYKLYEDVGKEGFEGFGGSKWLKSMWNDPSGRRSLIDLDAAMPKNRRFLNDLIDFSETQRLRTLLHKGESAGGIADIIPFKVPVKATKMGLQISDLMGQGGRSVARPIAEFGSPIKAQSTAELGPRISDLIKKRLQTQ